MSPVLAIAVYVIIWWLAFFAVLPLGAKSHHEAGEAPPPGSEAGAPLAHRLPMKAGLAAAIAAVVWLGVYWGVSVDLFGVLRAR
ncbi:MAG TPA: DUF1467 family protein [Caulobacterales bacterium]|nr:DUF1467 family protein [Caulobacterales bacterium]